jgi:hypothetical protein
MSLRGDALKPLQIFSALLPLIVSACFTIRWTVSSGRPTPRRSGFEQAPEDPESLARMVGVRRMFFLPCRPFQVKQNSLAQPFGACLTGDLGSGFNGLAETHRGLSEAARNLRGPDAGRSS